MEGAITTHEDDGTAPLDVEILKKMAGVQALLSFIPSILYAFVIQVFLNLVFAIAFLA